MARRRSYNTVSLAAPVPKIKHDTVVMVARRRALSTAAFLEKLIDEFIALHPEECRVALVELEEERKRFPNHW